MALSGPRGMEDMGGGGGGSIRIPGQEVTYHVMRRGRRPVEFSNFDISIFTVWQAEIMKTTYQ